jgi:hypothetical protein
MNRRFFACISNFAMLYSEGMLLSSFGFAFFVGAVKSVGEI